MDTAVRYLGLPLANPLIAGACPLTGSVSTAKELEDAGAGAIVMHSLFEEQLLLDQERLANDIDRPAESFAEALSYFPRVQEFRFRLGPDQYLEEIASLKAALSIPVIASLNGISTGGWIDYAQQIEQAGADAVELNAYVLPIDPAEPGTEVEEKTLAAVRAVRGAIEIPLAVKILPFYSSPANFIRRLADAGANGAVLFNRVYQPEIRIEELDALPVHRLSDSSELPLRIQWLAVCSDRVNLSLAATGGVHTAVDAIQAIMAGAAGVQMVSALLRNGAQHLRKVLGEMVAWMEAHEYESVDQMRGSMGHTRCPDPSVHERAGYLHVLHGKPSSRRTTR